MTHTVSEDVFTVVLVKVWICYLCHLTIILSNPEMSKISVVKVLQLKRFLFISEFL